MKWFLLLLPGIALSGSNLRAQELFPSTEPASNMPRHSVGIRMNAEGGLNGTGTRFSPEIMVGASSRLMVHGALYYSDFYSSPAHSEGFGFYGKYRFLSKDAVQKHFRGAVFARYSAISHPVIYDEINLEGDNSGVQAGLVFTQLLHKLALSASTGYTKAGDNGDHPRPASGEQLNYSLSAGYLAFPKEYTGYSQPNLNLYFELLGKSGLGDDLGFAEAAPGIQLILASRLRLDASKRMQLAGNMSRSSKNNWLFRLEYSLFNVF